MEQPTKPIEYFAVPDDLGPPRMSDVQAYDRLRVITDAHQFIVPIILLLAALLLWFSLRRPAGRLRRLVGLWFEAKERELRARGKDD